MRRPLRYLLLVPLLCATSIPVVAQDWSGSGRVTGLVTTEEGAPIKGAKVIFRMAEDPDSGPEPFITDKKGKFSFLGLKGGTWTVRVEAEGYEPWTDTVEVFSSGVSEKVGAVLTPLPKEVIVAQQRFKAQERLDAAKALLEQGDVAGAVKEYEAAMRGVEERDYPVVLSNLGALYLSTGDIAKAKETYQRALAINPGHVASLKGMCAIVASEGNFREAEALLEKVPPTEPLHPTTTMNIGMSYYNQGEMDKAKVYLDRTVRDHKEVSQAYYFRGLINLSLGDNEAAASDFSTYLELDPEGAKVAEVKEYLSYLKGDR
jgi:Tfp pilus assembly protein PilF